MCKLTKTPVLSIFHQVSVLWISPPRHIGCANPAYYSGILKLQFPLIVHVDIDKSQLDVALKKLTDFHNDWWNILVS